MVTITEAQKIILNYAMPLPAVETPLVDCLGRIAAQDQIAPWDVPPADNSAMDGFAFSHALLTGNVLKVTGILPAGESRDIPVPAGEAVRIMTGAPLPPGCDTVVPLEDVTEEGETIRLAAPVKAGSHVRRRGEDIRAGEVVIPAGSLLRPQEIGMLAAMGKMAVPVFRAARVAILSTGDELLEPGMPPAPGKIINSNSYSLAAQVLDAGAEPVMLGIAPDERSATLEKIRLGLQADFLVTTGGVSVGDRDYVKDAIEELGGEILFWKVNMKPGKPVAFAVVGGKPVFALPGNPVAAMVAFEQFVRPALLKAMGHRRILRPVVKATLLEGVENRGKRPHLVRGLVELRSGRYRVRTTGSQSSGRLASLTGGNGLIVLAPDSSLGLGSEVDVQLLDRSFEMGEFSEKP
uniref:Molybdopterin molybdenumtransferase n=1 Tax=Geobacter metallireducens TaxID=28232 RepID=A0A831U040_GEOME